MALVGGMAVALDAVRGEKAVADHAVRLFAVLARKACAATDSADVVAVCVEAVAQLSSGPQRMARLLAREGGGDMVVLTALTDAAFSSSSSSLHTAAAVDLITEIVFDSATRFAAGWRVVQAVHAWATAQLLAHERAGGVIAGDVARTVDALRVLECVLLRFYSSSSSSSSESRDGLWILIVDALGVLYPETLHSFGRDAQPDAFRSACALAIGYTNTAAATTGNIDCMVRSLFTTAQPYLFSSAPGTVGKLRSAVILFYLDLLEHLADRLSTHVVEHLVMPLAVRYSDEKALEYPGPAWFESAHALILAVLEASSLSALAAEIAPWYSELVLSLYPDRGISADLLRISYTASVRASAAGGNNAVVAWDRVAALLRKTDTFDHSRAFISVAGAAAGKVRMEVWAARYRELLMAACELLTAAPLEMMSRLMDEVRKRVMVAVSSRATRRAVVEYCQEMVLVRADVARKPALSVWVWQLLTDVNQLDDTTYSKM
ncbi:hypothetical protein GGF38_001732 [Coemansia sp. RSA 25]|nr:hypothetical protein GGF38_001732 [Coemansia sp. RSA 25]